MKALLTAVYLSLFPAYDSGCRHSAHLRFCIVPSLSQPPALETAPKWSYRSECWVQMRLLIEEGAAFIDVTDRWGNTPLDEARRAGARPCAAYLERCIAQHRGRTDNTLSYTVLIQFDLGIQLPDATSATCMTRHSSSRLWSYCSGCRFGPTKSGASGHACMTWRHV